MIVTLFPVLVGVFVGAVVGVFVGEAVVVVLPPQAARSTRRPAASRHSQTFVVING